jgi:hypothetical protein
MQRLDAWKPFIVVGMIVRGDMGRHRWQMQRLGFVLGICGRRGTLEWALLFHCAASVVVVVVVEEARSL